MIKKALDYKKEYKELYMPKQQAVLIDVPAMSFITVDGSGDPLSEEYHEALDALYALSYTIRMAPKSGNEIKGYFEYVVPPLEGLWCAKDGKSDLLARNLWRWKSMIRQPEFVTQEVFEWAISECRRKKSEVDTSKARLETLTEGLCVQIMHIGPYSTEDISLARIAEFIDHQGLTEDMNDNRRHHEIYLGDPRKTAPERLKTVLRIPVKR